MKTSELEGALLDYWVGKAEGLAVRLEFFMTNPPKPAACWRVEDGKVAFDKPYSPSTDRLEGGLIIEREGIATWRGGACWFATHPATFPSAYGGGNYIDVSIDESTAGPTPLIAAMRAFIASKFGDEVPQ